MDKKEGSRCNLIIQVLSEITEGAEHIHLILIPNI
jgi:hypothetical protein